MFAAHFPLFNLTAFFDQLLLLLTYAGVVQSVFVTLLLRNRSVLYATSTPELGLVETLAHAPAVRYEDLPTYWVFSLEVPDDIRYFNRDQLPSYWQDETYERTQTWLTPWLASPDQLGVAVPSVLVPLSYNVLLHPAHPLFDQIQIVDQEIQPVDRRLWR